MLRGLRRRGRHVGVAALFLVAPLAGCGSPAPGDGGPTTASIGILASGDGRESTADTDAVRGAQLAVELVNRSYPEVPMPLAATTGLPGLRGATLSLAVADTGGQPEMAANMVNSLINGGARALVVFDQADVAEAAGSQAQRLQVPLVDGASTAEYLTELGMDWYFRTVPTDRALADAAFALVRRQVGANTDARIALLTEAGGQTAATAALVRDMAVRAGHTVAWEGAVPDGAIPDCAAPDPAASADAGTASLVADSGCDVVLALATTAAAAAAAFDIGSQLSTPIIGLGSGFAGAARAPGTNPAALRAASWSAELAARSPVGRAVTDLYERQFGVPMTIEAANAFTATMTLALAIDEAGSSEPPLIRGALRQLALSATQMIMPWNGIRFDSNGQNRLAAAVVEGSDPAGFRVVYPRELSAGPVIWTTPPTGSPR